MNNVKIIVSVCKIYDDIAEVFFKLFSKNWPNCPYDLIVSTDYESDSFPSNCIIYKGGNSLPNNILEISKKYPAEYYICLLGDAFIFSEIDTAEFDNLIQCLKINNIEYCKLFTYSTDRTKKTMIRKADLHRPYEVSFIAFVASKKFIQREFLNNISDFEFEYQYLNRLTEKKAQSCFDENNYAVVTYNILHIRHGIQKGLWIRETYNGIKRIDSSVTKNKRGKLSIAGTIYRRLAIFINHGPFPQIRVCVKKLHLLKICSKTK